MGLTYVRKKSVYVCKWWIHVSAEIIDFSNLSHIILKSGLWQRKVTHSWTDVNGVDTDISRYIT